MTDVQVNDQVPDDFMEDIFKRQRSLMLQYEDIERENGFYVPASYPVELDDRHDQLFIKNQCWRVTEELMEALEAYDHDNQVHFIEELSDALHFHVELCIWAGVDASGLPESVGPFNHSADVAVGVYALEVIYELGLAMNCLKNKPWKVSHMATDKPKCKEYIRDAFIALLCFLDFVGVSGPDIWSVYVQKNTVNKFRIESKY